MMRKKIPPFAKPEIKQQVFIDNCKSIHGDKYDYTNTIYKGSSKRVEIICSKHGRFYQLPNHHMNGSGCRKCAFEKASKKYRMSKEEFLIKAKKKHGEFYNYDTVKLGNNNKCHVQIQCPKHGQFTQSVTDHLSGKRCFKCGLDVISQKTRFSKEQFVKKATVTHGDRYNYNKSIYIGSEHKLIITCPVHGDFEQNANAHVQGRGCLQCCNDNRRGWSKKKWLNFCEKNNYQYAKVYILKCKLKKETFLKIGLSSNLKVRLRKDIDQIEILNTITGSPLDTWNLEKRLHKVFKEHRYTPKTKFGGYTECFSSTLLTNKNFTNLLTN